MTHKFASESEFFILPVDEFFINRIIERIPRRDIGTRIKQKFWEKIRTAERQEGPVL